MTTDRPCTTERSIRTATTTELRRWWRRAFDRAGAAFLAGHDTTGEACNAVCDAITIEIERRGE